MIGNSQNPGIQHRGHSFDQSLTKFHTCIEYGKWKCPFNFQGQRSRSQIGNGQNPCIQPRGHSFDQILTKIHSLGL